VIALSWNVAWQLLKHGAIVKTKIAGKRLGDGFQFRICVQDTVVQTAKGLVIISVHGKFSRLVVEASENGSNWE
jgi:hypothetical protein